MEYVYGQSFRSLCIDWEKHAASLIGQFRSTCGKYSEDTMLSRLVEELKAGSELFSEFWSSHEVEIKSEVYKRLNHPTQGILDFEVCYFEVAENPALRMIVHTPLIGTDTKLKMKKLMSND